MCALLTASGLRRRDRQTKLLFPSPLAGWLRRCVLNPAAQYVSESNHTAACSETNFTLSQAHPCLSFASACSSYSMPPRTTCAGSRERLANKTPRFWLRERFLNAFYLLSNWRLADALPPSVRALALASTLFFILEWSRMVGKETPSRESILRRMYIGFSGEKVEQSRVPIGTKSFAVRIFPLF